MNPNQTDHTLIKAIVSGDTRAFETLIERYKNLVYNVTLRMVNEEDAQEVAQDVFLKIYQSLESFKGESKLSTWIYKITYRKCLDVIKKNKRKQSMVETNELSDYKIADLDNAFDQLAYKDKQQCIQQCLKKLPKEDSYLINLYYFEELSLEEVAKVIEVSPNNAKVKLFRARKKLGTILEQYVAPELLEGYGKQHR